MSLQMYMKIDGVTGGCKVFKYKGWSEVLSWNWGMTSNRKSAQGITGEKTSLNELSIIKPVGIESTDIRLLFAQGVTIPEIEFSITPVVGKRETQTKYVHINLEGVVIKSIVTGGGVDDNFFKEHITLLFDRINFEYTQNAGMADAASAANDESKVDHQFSWDVPSNSVWKQQNNVENASLVE